MINSQKKLNDPLISLKACCPTLKIFDSSTKIPLTLPLFIGSKVITNFR